MGNPMSPSQKPTGHKEQANTKIDQKIEDTARKQREIQENLRNQERQKEENRKRQENSKK
jgi:hypothetical protein